VFSTPPTNANTSFTDLKLSPDQQTIAAVSYRTGYDGAGVLYFINPAEQSFRVIDLGSVRVISEPAFHPSGKWLAVPVLIAAGTAPHDETPPEELPQPRIHIVDVAAGKIVETLIAPQCYLNSATFSPDGKTLASSGEGEVLLWDFSNEPEVK
jgi:WD40 repeat protein